MIRSNYNSAGGKPLRQCDHLHRIDASEPRSRRRLEDDGIPCRHLVVPRGFPTSGVEESNCPPKMETWQRRARDSDVWGYSRILDVGAKRFLDWNSTSRLAGCSEVEQYPISPRFLSEKSSLGQEVPGERAQLLQSRRPLGRGHIPKGPTHCRRHRARCRGRIPQ